MGVCWFALEFLALMMVTATASAKTLSNNPSTIRSLLSHARRLEDQDQDKEHGETEVEAYLMNYSIKLLHCHPEEFLTSNNNDDDGDYTQYGVVVFRMCPSDSCSDNKKGCTSGYADFAVNLGTFVEAYMEDQSDNMQWDDDKMDVSNFAQCAQYEVENQADDDAAAKYYVGPSCTADHLDVQLDLFVDQYCLEKSSKTFSDISNGWTLPYSDGGLVSTACLSCGEQSNDGGDLDLKELCTTLYEDAPYKCEADWPIQHYYWDAITEIYRFGQD
jgi:hypothetical protein